MRNTGRTQTRWLRALFWQLGVAILLATTLVAFGLAQSTETRARANRLSELGQAPTFTILLRFTGRADGANPGAGVIQDSADNLYGTTVNGGNLSCFVGELDTRRRRQPLHKAGNGTVLHRFTGGADGANPDSVLVQDAAGNLYGMAGFGGTMGCFGNGCGTVFKLVP